MDYLDKIIEKIKNFARKLVEVLVGPEAEPELEVIPIPIRDRR
ncbi:DNA topoisomerase I [Acaryochloris sp. IP29b_bin.148]|nr:DNA topoisomerase I [Acaryochloris sp. IP29b_bin.148]